MPTISLTITCSPEELGPVLQKLLQQVRASQRELVSPRDTLLARPESRSTFQAGADPVVTYKHSRLCFRADLIEPLAPGQSFRIHTPLGVFQMTKEDFYRDFSNVVASSSYKNRGIYHYPQLPKRASAYRIDTSLAQEGAGRERGPNQG